VPGVLAVRQDSRRPDQRSHVHVMPAGVHDADFASRIVLGMHFAGIRQAGLFFHRKRIKLGAQHDRGPGAVLQDGHHSRPAHVFGDGVAKISQMTGKLLRGLDFMRREFRILVEVKIQGVGLGIDGLYLSVGRGSLSPGNGGQHNGQKPVCQFHRGPHDIWSKDRSQ